MSDDDLEILMPAIQCQIRVNGEQKWLPLDLTFEDEKPFVILEFKGNKEVEPIKIPLKKSRMAKPLNGIGPWSYKGLLLEIRNMA